AIAPAEHQPEVLLLATSHVRQVHDVRDDAPRHEAVVVVERPVVPWPEAALGVVRERQGRRPRRAGEHAPGGPGNPHERPPFKVTISSTRSSPSGLWVISSIERSPAAANTSRT